MGRRGGRAGHCESLPTLAYPPSHTNQVAQHVLLCHGNGIVIIPSEGIWEPGPFQNGAQRRAHSGLGAGSKWGRTTWRASDACQPKGACRLVAVQRRGHSVASFQHDSTLSKQSSMLNEKENIVVRSEDASFSRFLFVWNLDVTRRPLQREAGFHQQFH